MARFSSMLTVAVVFMVLFPSAPSFGVELPGIPPALTLEAELAVLEQVVRSVAETVTVDGSEGGLPDFSGQVVPGQPHAVMTFTLPVWQGMPDGLGIEPTGEWVIPIVRGVESLGTFVVSVEGDGVLLTRYNDNRELADSLLQSPGAVLIEDEPVGAAYLFDGARVWPAFQPALGYASRAETLDELTSEVSARWAENHAQPHVEGEVGGTMDNVPRYGAQTAVGMTMSAVGLVALAILGTTRKRRCRKVRDVPA